MPKPTIMPKKRGATRRRDKAVPPSSYALAKRIHLAGSTGDPNRTSTPLDLLLSHGLIEGRQLSAGVGYAALYRFAIGQTSRPTMWKVLENAGFSPSGRWRDLDDEQIKAEFERVTRRVKQTVGQAALREIVRVAVTHEWPDFLAPYLVHKANLPQERPTFADFISSLPEPPKDEPDPMAGVEVWRPIRYRRYRYRWELATLARGLAELHGIMRHERIVTSREQTGREEGERRAPQAV